MSSLLRVWGSNTNPPSMMHDISPCHPIIPMQQSISPVACCHNPGLSRLLPAATSHCHCHHLPLDNIQYSILAFGKLDWPSSLLPRGVTRLPQDPTPVATAALCRCRMPLLPLLLMAGQQEAMGRPAATRLLPYRQHYNSQQQRWQQALQTL